MNYKKNVNCIILFAFLFGLTVLSSKANNFANKMNDFSESMAIIQVPGENDLPSDACPITVYLIVGTNAWVTKNAHYSPSKNRIYIKEGKYLMNYNVHENPQYGQDSAKGKYKYYASDYYFDL